MPFSARGRVMVNVRCSYRHTVGGPARACNLCCNKHSLILISTAPYLDSGDLEFAEYTEQNHLMQPSPYRGHPTPAVEDAWIRLWRCMCHPKIQALVLLSNFVGCCVTVPYVQFPEDKLPLLNKTPAERYAHTEDGGVQGFLNIFHQLHCLVSVFLPLSLDWSRRA